MDDKTKNNPHNLRSPLVSAMIIVVSLVAGAISWLIWTNYQKGLAFKPVGKIAFNCGPGWPDICISNADGTGLKQITGRADRSSNSHTWSNDGKKIAFVADPISIFQPALFVINVDGSNKRQIVKPEMDSALGSLSWSPDDIHILFTKQVFNYDAKKGKSYSLFIVNSEDLTMRQLTQSVASDRGSWSPDGSLIVYSRTQYDPIAGTSQSNIFVIKPDGSDERLLTQRNGEFPSWSPDSKKIVFVDYPISTMARGERKIYVVNTDGSGEKMLADVNSGSPLWSPDGKRIVFTCSQNSIGGICVINHDGTGLIQLTSSWERSPSWSPDQQYIAYEASDPLCFLCNVTGVIWVMKSDGSYHKKIADWGITLRPVWQPKP